MVKVGGRRGLENEEADSFLEWLCRKRVWQDMRAFGLIGWPDIKEDQH